MPSYPFTCPECDTSVEFQMSISEYSEWKSAGCSSPECYYVLTKKDRVLTAPNVTRETYVMGTVRPGFAEQREIMKLEHASYNLRPEDRKDIKKEISTIKERGK
tara:strand:- start:462 stop:773 length:312 start_codon:yes stop_codon:yes gene_type:complete